MWHSSGQPSIISLVWCVSRYVAIVEVIHINDFNDLEIITANTARHMTHATESTYWQALLYKQVTTKM